MSKLIFYSALTLVALAASPVFAQNGQSFFYFYRGSSGAQNYRQQPSSGFSYDPFNFETTLNSLTPSPTYRTQPEVNKDPYLNVFSRPFYNVYHPTKTPLVNSIQPTPTVQNVVYNRPQPRFQYLPDPQGYQVGQKLYFPFSRAPAPQQTYYVHQYQGGAAAPQGPTSFTQVQGIPNSYSIKQFYNVVNNKNQGPRGYSYQIGSSEDASHSSIHFNIGSPTKPKGFTNSGSIVTQVKNEIQGEPQSSIAEQNPKRDANIDNLVVSKQDTVVKNQEDDGSEAPAPEEDNLLGIKVNEDLESNVNLQAPVASPVQDEELENSPESGFQQQAENSVEQALSKEEEFFKSIGNDEEILPPENSIKLPILNITNAIFMTPTGINVTTTAATFVTLQDKDEKESTQEASSPSSSTKLPTRRPVMVIRRKIIKVLPRSQKTKIEKVAATVRTISAPPTPATTLALPEARMTSQPFEFSEKMEQSKDIVESSTKISSVSNNPATTIAPTTPFPPAISMQTSTEKLPTSSSISKIEAEPETLIPSADPNQTDNQEEDELENGSNGNFDESLISPVSNHPDEDAEVSSLEDRSIESSPEDFIPLPHPEEENEMKEARNENVDENAPAIELIAEVMELEEIKNEAEDSDTEVSGDQETNISGASDDTGYVELMAPVQDLMEPDEEALREDSPSEEENAEPQLEIDDQDIGLDSIQSSLKISQEEEKNDSEFDRDQINDSEPIIDQLEEFSNEVENERSELQAEEVPQLVTNDSIADEEKREEVESNEVAESPEEEKDTVLTRRKALLSTLRKLREKYKTTSTTTSTTVKPVTKYVRKPFIPSKNIRRLTTTTEKPDRPTRRYTRRPTRFPITRPTQRTTTEFLESTSSAQQITFTTTTVAPLLTTSQPVEVTTTQPEEEDISTEQEAMKTTTPGSTTENVNSVPDDVDSPQPQLIGGTEEAVVREEFPPLVVEDIQQLSMDADDAESEVFNQLAKDDLENEDLDELPMITTSAPIFQPAESSSGDLNEPSSTEASVTPETSTDNDKVTGIEEKATGKGKDSDMYDISENEAPTTTNPEPLTSTTEQSVLKARLSGFIRNSEGSPEPSTEAPLTTTFSSSTTIDPLTSGDFSSPSSTTVLGSTTTENNPSSSSSSSVNATTWRPRVKVRSRVVKRVRVKSTTSSPSLPSSTDLNENEPSSSKPEVISEVSDQKLSFEDELPSSNEIQSLKTQDSSLPEVIPAASNPEQVRLLKPRRTRKVLRVIKVNKETGKRVRVQRFPRRSS